MLNCVFIKNERFNYKNRNDLFRTYNLFGSYNIVAEALHCQKITYKIYLEYDNNRQGL